jgi:DNA (cytosine-5)-methyltransferase 1
VLSAPKRCILRAYGENSSATWYLQKKPPRVIHYRDALRVILGSNGGETFPESIRNDLPAVAPHWLPMPEVAPLFLGREMVEKLPSLLSTYTNSGTGRLLNFQRKAALPQIDYSGVPFSPQNKPKFTFIDLFAGIGGFRIAFQHLGGKCLFSSEWDHYAKETH